ncbi:MAG: cation:proton antiporter [Clostridia bacterium]|nr:cation:proton antiporter [Clostridia bacterium]
MELLLSLSIALLVGLMLSRLAKLIQLPAVTAYLIAGILIGPCCIGAFGVEGLGFTSFDNVEQFKLLCEIALGFIAFSIGNEFRLSQLKKIGKQATVIGIVQAVMATIFVDAVLIVVHLILGDKFPLPVAIVLGAIASATAPAATLMVVKQYKAKGPLTDILLPVVALDDAVGLVLFAVSFGIARALEAGKINLISMAVEPILDIVLSLALGALMGFLFTQAEKLFHSRSKRMAMSVTFVLLTVALSKITFEIGGVHFGFSPLLVCMMLGTIFCNICDFSEELMDRIDRWTAPIFILFFVLSGAELDLLVFLDITIIVIGLLYIVARSAGKYTGAFLSSKATKCSPTIVKYLGITLLPQAGVALGMAMDAKDIIAGGSLIYNITLFAVLIYEVVGPMLTKICLLRAGEIKPEHKTTQRHEANKNAHA